MENKVKSIFRRREVEKIYEVNIKQNGRYFSERTFEPVINIKSENVISDDVIGSYDVEMPLLEHGERFYLTDIEEEVVIDRRMRSSDGSIVYYAKDKIVNTENTKISYEKCVVSIENWNHDEEEIENLRKTNKDYEEKLLKLEDQYSWYKNTYKYEHRFFNSKAN